MSETPNVVIESPAVRRVFVLVLGIVAIVTACAAIVLGFWPELAGLKPDPSRIIATINAIISFLSGAFGLGVTLPNIPKNGTAANEPDGFDPALAEVSEEASGVTPEAKSIYGAGVLPCSTAEPASGSRFVEDAAEAEPAAAPESD